jgi:hypothetical protein
MLESKAIVVRTKFLERIFLAEKVASWIFATPRPFLMSKWLLVLAKIGISHFDVRIAVHMYTGMESAMKLFFTSLLRKDSN